MKIIISRELRALLALTLPILATQLAQIGMGTIDTIMSGYVSTQDLAAVAIGTAIWLPTWLFMAGVLVALTPMASRRLGQLGHTKIKHDDQPQNQDQQQDRKQALSSLFNAAVMLALFSSILCSVLLAIIAVLITNWLDDPQMANICQDYLFAIAISMPAAGLFLSARFYAEALNAAHRVTRIMLIGLLLNIPFNAIFVYGWFGLPALGGAGCGLGTLCVMLFLAVAMVTDVRRSFLPNHWSIDNVWQTINWSEIKQLAVIGLPIGIAIFFEVSLFTVIALLITDLGPEVVAAHQVALNVSSLTFMLPLSLGMSLTVRVSRHLGRQHPEKARSSAWLGVRFNLLLAVINAILLIMLSAWLARWYTPDPAVQILATNLLYLAAAFQLSDAIQIAAAGALRGYHDTRAVMILTFISYWLVGLCSGYWLAYGSPALGIFGFWVGLIIGLTMAALTLAMRLRLIAKNTIREDKAAQLDAAL